MQQPRRSSARLTVSERLTSYALNDEEKARAPLAQLGLATFAVEQLIAFVRI